MAWETTLRRCLPLLDMSPPEKRTRCRPVSTEADPRLILLSFEGSFKGKVVQLQAVFQGPVDCEPVAYI